MKNLPEKPIINQVTIYFRGESSAGISAQTFNVPVFIDLNDLTPLEKGDLLKDIRLGFANLYELMIGETPEITFDFEYERNEPEYDGGLYE